MGPDSCQCKGTGHVGHTPPVCGGTHTMLLRLETKFII